jgi:predicted permease
VIFKHAYRQLVLRPGHSAIVIAMLGLGIGAATAIFALFHQVLVQPLPVPDPARLVNVVRTGPEASLRGEAFSYPMFRDLETEQTAIAGIAAHSPFSANIAYGDGAFGVQGVFVSGGYFAVLGLRPALGRLVGPQDEPRVGESPVVVLSHELWQSRFGGDPGVVGRELRIDGQSLTVIGVAPAGFSGTRLGVRSGLDTPDARNFNWVFAFARLRDDVTVEQASAALDAVYRRVRTDIEAPRLSLPDDALRRFLSGRIALLPGARGQGSIAGAAQSLTLLLGVTLLVLLIVGVNVANLLLVRGAARAGEMAIRESMGASRARLLMQLLAETALPAVIGGALALPVAMTTLSAVKPILPHTLAEGLAMQIDSTAIAFAALSTVASALLFGLFPALRTSRTNPALAIKGYAPQTLGGQGAPRVRAALVTAQIAFSMVLLVLAGLFAESLNNVARIDLGMDVDSLVSFSVSPRLNGYDAERTAALYDRIERALAAEPGVTGVAAAAVPVIAGGNFEAGTQVEGLDNGGRPVVASFNIVGPAFFHTLGIPLRAGREFTAKDEVGAPRVAIVNERFARQFGLDGNAIGKRLGGSGPDALEIVGVVADAAYSDVKGEIPPEFFMPRGSSEEDIPFFSFLSASSTFYVRAGVDPDALLRTIPRVVAAVDPTLPVNKLVTMRRQAQESVFVDRLLTILSASFAALATLLAAIGLYGVMAYSVAARTRELGLRLALGAEPARLRSMVLKQVGWMTAIGLAIGLLAAIGSGRAAETLLFGLSGRDPLVLAGAAAVLAAVVLAASYGPARRASRIEPMEALRHERT